MDCLLIVWWVFCLGVIIAKLISIKRNRRRREFEKSHKVWQFSREPTERAIDASGKELRPNCTICKEKIWDEESFMSHHPLGYYICLKCVPKVFIWNPEID